MLMKMESEPLYDSSTWIRNAYAHGAIKKNCPFKKIFMWQYSEWMGIAQHLLTSTQEFEAGTFVRGLPMDFAGLDCLFQQM
jgi:hypothetical protein